MRNFSEKKNTKISSQFPKKTFETKIKKNKKLMIDTSLDTYRVEIAQLMKKTIGVVDCSIVEHILSFLPKCQAVKLFSRCGDVALYKRFSFGGKYRAPVCDNTLCYKTYKRFPMARPYNPYCANCGTAISNQRRTFFCFVCENGGTKKYFRKSLLNEDAVSRNFWLRSKLGNSLKI